MTPAFLRGRPAFTCLICLFGLLANCMAVQLPGSVPFLLGNMAAATLSLRLGWRYGLFAAIVCTLLPVYWINRVAELQGWAMLEALQWALLAILEALLLSRFRTRPGLGTVRMWCMSGLPLLLLAAILCRRMMPEPSQWTLGVLIILTNSVIALVGARLIVRITQARARRQTQPFRDQLGSHLSVATATPLAILTMVLLQFSYRDGVEDRQLLMEQRAREIQSLTEHHLDSHLNVIAFEARRVGAAAAAQLNALRAVYPGFLTLLAADARGDIVSFSANAPPSVLPNVADRAYFSTPRATGKAYISPVFRGRGFGSDLIVAVSAPIRDAELRFLGVIEGSLSLSSMDALIRSIGRNSYDYAVVDDSGQVVFSSLNGLAGLADARKEASLTFGRTLADGALRLNASGSQLISASVGGSHGWRVYALQDFSGLRTEQLRDSLLGALLCLSLILVLQALANRFADRYAATLAALAGRVHHFDLRHPEGLAKTALTGDTAELHELIVGFDAMVDRLSQLHRERSQALEALSDTNRQLESRVSARTAELSNALATAEALTRSKSIFLANMSHELRTPLAAILGYTEQALQHDAPASMWHDALQTIDRNGRHLLSIVNDVLDASKIEAGQVEFEHAPLSPSALVTEVIGMLEPRAEEKALRLTSQFQWPYPESVDGDRLRLKQVLINFVSNAIKFTEQGEVVVRLAADAACGLWWLEVQDSGIGISAEHKERLFERFEQADASTTRRFGGSGLGLYISRELVTGMGGRIHVDSTPGKGSTFRISFPLPAQPGGQDGATAAPLPLPAAAPKVAIPQLHGKVLLAEDVADLRLLMVAILQRTGVEVVEASNGLDAFGYAFAQRFDLVLMDMHMPGMDGSQATDSLRKHGYDGPIVALTADVMEEDVARYLAVGCDAVLAKPVDRLALYALLEKYLQGAAAGPSLAVDPLHEVLEPLRQSFRTRLRDEIAALMAERDAGDLVALRARLHQIKGTGSTLGFARIHQLAEAVELAERATDRAGLDEALASLFEELSKNVA